MARCRGGKAMSATLQARERRTPTPRARPARVPAAAGVGAVSAANLLFVLPYIVILLVLLVVPLCLGIWLSFQDYDMLGGYNGFVGLDNFRNLLKDDIFVGAVRN